MTADRLAEIRARVQAATKGPWEPCREYGPNFYAFQQGEYLAGVGDFNFGDGAQADADREFTIHAPADIPWLVAELTETLAKLEIAERQARELDRALSDTIRERDFADDMADKLAYAVAPIEDIGEHSSENCPWQNALDLVTPAAEVDRLRREVADLETGLGLNEAA